MNNQKMKTSRLTLVIIPLLVIVGIVSQVNYTSKKMNWTEVAMIQPELRGDDGTVLDPVYSEAEIATLYQSFQGSVVSVFEENSAPEWYLFKKPDVIDLNTTVQELTQGVLSISVNATLNDSTPATWEQTFDSPDSFTEDLQSFASEVGKSIAEM